jgi:2-polyprenyl-3-methyl-5-hydroxy-6-metoxy-1,4-benzoquinol methylase
VPHRLQALLKAQASGFHLLDVGCGDGQLVWALMDQGLLPGGARVTGVDISPVRVQRFTALTGWPAVQAQGADLATLPDEAADIIVSTMVMEHVPDDAAYARALARVTRQGGTVFLTTVLRKPGAWYFRKAPDGRRVLDPTHVREYASVDEVRQTLEAAGLEVLESGLERLVFPVLVPAVRLWNARWPIRDVQRFFLRQPWAALESLGLPIPRYREMQFVLRRKPGPAPAPAAGAASTEAAA